MNLPEIIRIAYEMGYTLFVIGLTLGLLVIDTLLIRHLFNKSRSLFRAVKIYYYYTMGKFEYKRKLKTEITKLQKEITDICPSLRGTTVPMEMEYKIRGLEIALEIWRKEIE